MGNTEGRSITLPTFITACLEGGWEEPILLREEKNISFSLSNPILDILQLDQHALNLKPSKQNIFSVTNYNFFAYNSKISPESEKFMSRWKV